MNEKKIFFQRLFFLTSSDDLDLHHFLDGEISKVITLKKISTLDSLFVENLSSKDLLISYATSSIVPKEILKQLGGAYNVHAAPPTYPGRDPHHFALYHGEKEYGVTIHVMEEEVDAGDIVEAVYFKISDGTFPDELLREADKVAIQLIKRFLFKALFSPFPLSAKSIPWGAVKNTRQDFLNLCEIPLDISLEELEHRIKTCVTKKYKNLKVTLHGYTFKLE